MVTRFQVIQQHLLYGCFFIAFCAGGVTLAAMLEGKGPLEWRLPLAVTGATLVHYNLHYLFQKSSQVIETPRMRWSRAHPQYLYCYVGLGLLCILPYARQVDWNIFRLWVPVVLIGITYSFPVMPFRIRRWKEQGLLKWLLLSLTWTLVTAWIPLATQDINGEAKGGLLLLRLELLLALCWLFDMRDRAVDQAHGVNTLPVQWGWKRSKQLAYGWVVVYLLTGLIVYPLASGDLRTWVHLTTALALGIVTYATQEKKSDYFYLFWVDGLLLFHFLCMAGAHLATNGRYFW